MDNQNQKGIALIQPQQLTCLANLAINKQPISDISLIELSSELMPKGEPNFLAIGKLMSIQTMIDKKVATVGNIRASLVLLIKNFSESLNVVRNLSEIQAIEIAQMLIDECGNFRIEDYFLMFQMAKRGKIGDIRDRIDIQLISKLLEEYWQLRHSQNDALLRRRDEELAEKRREVQRKALGSGEVVYSSISKEEFAETIKTLERSIVENMDRNTLDEVKQAEIRKEMLIRRMKDTYGITDAQLEMMQDIRVKTVGSKINDMPTEP